MQTIKEKLNDMSTMRKAKAEAKAEEEAEKELAKARMEVAHEVRKAREAEAEMDIHIAKAAEMAEKETMKHNELGPEPLVAVTDDRQDSIPTITVDADPNLRTTITTHTTNQTNTAGDNPTPNLL